jgi:CTP-dependent riboflavin kinase
MVLIVKGNIASGVGRGRWFMGLDWVQQQIREKLGFEAYEGTLNVKLDDEADRTFQSFTKSCPGIPITPVDNTFAPGKAFNIKLGGKVDGALIIPLIPNYPPNQMEIIAPINLRETFELHDGDEVIVEIFES